MESNNVLDSASTDSMYSMMRDKNQGQILWNTYFIVYNLCSRKPLQRLKLDED